MAEKMEEMVQAMEEMETLYNATNQYLQTKVARMEAKWEEIYDYLLQRTTPPLAPTPSAAPAQTPPPPAPAPTSTPPLAPTPLPLAPAPALVAIEVATAPPQSPPPPPSVIAIAAGSPPPPPSHQEEPAASGPAPSDEMVIDQIEVSALAGTHTKTPVVNLTPPTPRTTQESTAYATTVLEPPPVSPIGAGDSEAQPAPATMVTTQVEAEADPHGPFNRGSAINKSTWNSCTNGSITSITTTIPCANSTTSCCTIEEGR
ncbi:hypothetical protein JOM56_012977 [Amanita muscaria]